MKTFFNILQTLTDIKIKKYPGEPFIVSNYINNTCEQSHIIYLINIIFSIQQKCKEENELKNNIFAKFSGLNQILNNLFNPSEFKDKVIPIFSKAQKHYHAFLRFAHIYKLKKYPLIVQDDLSLNPLNLNHRNTFILIENKCKYLFSLHDLISIIETAISNSPNFFTDSLWPLNPYNKQPFTVSTLYNIYFKMKYSGRLISTLFHYFFLTHFDLAVFSETYEAVIREHAIKKYVFNSPYDTLYPSLLTMLNQNIYTKQLNINNEFPKDNLINIFRPFLFYYYIINYDIKGTYKIYNYKKNLYQKLKKFYQYNKAFGRKYIKLIKNAKNRVIKKEYVFNTDHISFYKIPVSSNIADELVVIGTNGYIIMNAIINQNDENSSQDSSEEEYNDDDDTDNNEEDTIEYNNYYENINLNVDVDESESENEEIDEDLSVS